MIGNVVYVYVGLLVWVTIGVYIFMGTEDGGQTQPANLQEYTPEVRPDPANSTVKKGQVIGAAPELVSEAGEQILCLFWEHIASPLSWLLKPLLEARSHFLACCQGAM